MENQSVDADAWQRREGGGTVEAFIPMSGSERPSRLQWQTARSYRPPTSSAPRAPDDPFHDPFGDRKRSTDVSLQPPIAAPAVLDRFELSPVPAGSEPTEQESRVILAHHEIEEDLDPQPTPAEWPAPAEHSEPPLGPFHLQPTPASASRELPRIQSNSLATKRAKRQLESAPINRPATQVVESTAEVPPDVPNALDAPVATPKSQPAPRRNTRKEFRISDPFVKHTQFEQLEDDEELLEFIGGQNERLEDLFAPPEDQQDATMPPDQPESSETPDETDFNRPFDAEQESDQDSTSDDVAPPHDLQPYQAPERERQDLYDLDSPLTPELPAEPPKETEKCAEVYNERNCCEEGDECRKYIELLRTKTLRQISMDISPPFEPLAESPEIAKKLQEEQLARSPSRTWRDMQGRTLAEGRLIDLSYRDVIIEQPNGEQVAISSLNLGRDERCFVAAWWNLPSDCLPDEPPFPLRDFTLTTFTWTASGLCHRPLYFENVQLERYGHSAGPCLQPFLSGAHFFTSIALLPYNMGLYPPKECQYALGYYRPGNCAPWLVPAFPISKRAILAEATGIFALYGFLH